jgi:hypothetical protein
MQPDRTICNGPVKECKKVKYRIKLAFCTNAGGSDKRTVIMIGKCANL